MLRWLAAAVSAAMTTSVFAMTSLASPTQSSASAWANLTIKDVSTYCADIRATHPGMVDPLHPLFARRVNEACGIATIRARAATSYLDWRETLQALVTSFRDGHTNILFAVEPAKVRWPGFLIDGRNDHWVVRHVALPTAPILAPQNDPLEGANFLGCDGQSADKFLKTQLDNKSVDWSKLPERIRQGFRGFITARLDGPPPAKSCRFEKNGKATEIVLNWQTVSYPDLLPGLYPLLRRGIPHPIDTDFSPDGAVWVRVGSVQDETALKRLEKSLLDNEAHLRAAPYVVFDLRGDGGGNSTWGERLASILWGKEAVEARRLADQPTDPNDYGKYWRTSKEAAAKIAGVAEMFATRGPDFADIVQFWRQLGAKVAAVGHDGLLQDECCRLEPRPASIPKPEYAGKVFVLTDAGCFSSCVVVMGTLKRMGAIQVGEASGQNEVWGESAGPFNLPSGLGSYRIPVSIIRQPQSALGGLPPYIIWPGRMDDDTGLRTWIAGLASGSISRP